MPKIYLRKLRKYKYQLMEDYTIVVVLGTHKFTDVFSRFIYLTRTNEREGLLGIHKGYAWDGASGPTWDTKTSHRGSLVHDALYQLMRESHLPPGYREYADDLLREILLEDGMNKFRAWLWWKNCRAFGGRAARPRLLRGKIEES